MKFCRFRTSNGLSLGIIENGSVFDLTSTDTQAFRDLNSLYTKADASVTKMVELASEAMRKSKRAPLDYGSIGIPVKPVEIWAAGVTYQRSVQARESETKSKGLYDYVYDAKRPEIFLKDSGLRVRGPNEEIGIRGDSNWSVPEPELTVVCDGEAKVVGYTAGNDVSSRDIEGENPLYLPQAKVYRWSCSIGPVLATPDEIGDPHSLGINMRIKRNKNHVFEGSTNTSQMKRSVPELLSYLKRDNVLNTFTFLMTGTSIVPPDDFTLQTGDEVEIELEKIGKLINPVKKLSGT
jgi:2-dehydro-3-deoxy-D-arabinonate dehydratase